MSRVAVVLFNLGGPDSLAAVQPFLRNLFADPAIIAVPQPLRWCLARWIAARRAKTARDIYRKIGGGSPLRRLTEDQAAALQVRLGDLGTVSVFVAMRYWHPFVEDVARDVAAWNPRPRRPAAALSAVLHDDDGIGPGSVAQRGEERRH